MESFYITVGQETYVIVQTSCDDYGFTVFNHKTCHTIKKNQIGDWEAVQHRFGVAFLPVGEIGAAIDIHYGQMLQNG